MNNNLSDLVVKTINNATFETTYDCEKDLYIISVEISEDLDNYKSKKSIDQITSNIKNIIDISIQKIMKKKYVIIVTPI